MANLGSTVIHGNFDVTGKINRYTLGSASEKIAGSTVHNSTDEIPTSAAIVKYVTDTFNNWKTTNTKTNSNLTASISGATVSVTGPAGYYPGGVSKSGTIGNGSCTVAGGKLSVSSSSFTPTVTTTITKNVGTESTTKGAYYIQVNATSSSTSLSATRAEITDKHTAGYIPAEPSTTVIASTSVGITVNSGSAAVKYINIPAGTISSGSTDNSKTYVVNTTTVPSGGYLYIGAGYYPNTQISLSQIIPDSDAPDASSGNILSGYEAYNTSGNRIVGTMPTISLSSTYFTNSNTGFGPISIGYNPSGRYIIDGALAAQNLDTFAASSSGGNFVITSNAKPINPVSKSGWLNSSASTTINAHSDTFVNNVDFTTSELNTSLYYTVTATPKIKLNGAADTTYVAGTQRSTSRKISSVTLGASTDTFVTSLSVAVSSKGQLNVTSDAGTTNYMNWKIAKDSSNSLTFTYVG